MTKLLILSPHFDDAVFSLALTLGRLAAAGLRVTVVNFFTRSAYAPYITSQDVPTISSVRQREDRNALKQVHPAIQIENLDILDAPLRLGLPFTQLMVPASINKVPAEFIGTLCLLLQSKLRSDLVVAPLSLGNHVDHQTVHQAARLAFRPRQLGFYEDLPYASWTPQPEIKSRVRKMGAYAPVVIRDSRAKFKKRTASATYSSQILRRDAADIANYSESYGSGERLWLPEHDRRWTEVKQRARALRP